MEWKFADGFTDGRISSVALPTTLQLTSYVQPGEVGKPYADGATVAQTRNGTGGGGAGATGRNIQHALTANTTRAEFLKKNSGVSNTAGLQFSTVHINRFADSHVLLTAYNKLSRIDFQTMLQRRRQLSQGSFRLGSHVKHLIEGKEPLGITEFETLVFDSDLKVGDDMFASFARCFSNLTSLISMDGKSNGESKLVPKCSVGFLIGVAEEDRHKAWYVFHDKAYFLQMAGVLQKLNGWRELIQQIISQRLPIIAAAIAARKLTAGIMSDDTQSKGEKAEARTTLTDTLHRLKWQLPTMPAFEDMVPYGWDNNMAEPRDEDDRVEAGVLVDANEWIKHLPSTWFGPSQADVQPTGIWVAEA